jgi:hypothetical protein
MMPYILPDCFRSFDQTYSFTEYAVSKSFKNFGIFLQDYMPPYPRIWHSLSNKVCDGLGEKK